MKGYPYHQMKVTLDGEAEFDAEVRTDSHGLPLLWNGAIACPTFTRAEAEKVVEYINADDETAPDESMIRFRWEGDILVKREWNGEPISILRPIAYDEDKILPDQYNRYAIGAWAWVWAEVEEDGSGHA